MEEIREHILDVPTAEESHIKSWIYAGSSEAMAKSKFYDRIKETLVGAVEEGEFQVMLRLSFPEFDLFPAIHSSLRNKGYGVQVSYDKSDTSYIAVITW